MTSPKRKNPLGPTGATVAANVKRLRESAGMKYTDLADRLDTLGRPIPTLGLRKIETEDRRVDADDLVALSVALGVNPNAILLPPSSDSGHVLNITAAGHHPAVDVWRWARGEAPIIYNDVPESVPQSNRIAYARAAFESRSTPSAQDWTRSPNIDVVTALDGDD